MELASLGQLASCGYRAAVAQACWINATGKTTVLRPDGSFAFDAAPTEPIKLSTRIPDCRLARRRNRFQQLGPASVGVFVDADKLDLQLFFEPVPSKQ